MIFAWTHAIFTHVISIFGRFSIQNSLSSQDDIGIKRYEICMRIFELNKKFVRRCQPTRTPTQNLKFGLSTFSSWEISTCMVSFEVNFHTFNLSYPDSSSLAEFKNSKNSRNSTSCISVFKIVIWATYRF